MRHLKSQIGFFLAGVMAASLIFVMVQEDQLPEISPVTVGEAQKLSGLNFTEAQRDSMMNGLIANLENYELLRELELGNEILPALQFNPVPVGRTFEIEPQTMEWMLPEDVEVPGNRDELAFYPVEKLAALIRDRKITSMELTELYLERIRKYDDRLLTVVTLTEDMALRQAQLADEEIAAGRYRGPLHGIPYGTKDLLALEGYPVTWGSEVYKHQIADETATVIRNLEDAGAVHLAKLAMGELAWGDIWFGGMTRSPWNTDVGSSGSSAGSASATAAGLVAFSIGTETLGSIVSPSTRNGVTGLRPTYGRVSRHGAMALSWSMDKIGPITRNAQDAAIVFDAIYGPDSLDPTLYDLPFNYDQEFDFENLTIGFVKAAFDSEYGFQERDREVLRTLEKLGADLQPVSLPEMPLAPMRTILSVEAAAAFDDLTRSGRDSLMVRQIINAWPNVFRTARFVPAVEYIQANRARTLLIHQMDLAIRDVDVYVSPTFSGSNLLITNLTGHPSISVPTGFDEDSGLPTSITFNGHLFDEGKILALARAYQSVTSHHREIPDDFFAEE